MSGKYKRKPKIPTEIYEKPIKPFDEPEDVHSLDDTSDDSYHSDSNSIPRRISSTTKPSALSQSAPPTPSKPMPDGLDTFFAGIAATMRTFPQHEIAKLKLQISTIVGQAEVDLSRHAPDSLPMIYFPVGKNDAAADGPHKNIYIRDKEKETMAAKAVLIITQNEANEVVHDLTVDD